MGSRIVKDDRRFKKIWEDSEIENLGRSGEKLDIIEVNKKEIEKRVTGFGY